MAARLVNVPPEPNSMCGTNTGFLVLFAQMAVDADDQGVEPFVGDGVAELLAQPHRAQLRGVDRFDQMAESQHDFGAAAADVDDGDVLIGKIERALHAGERQQRFLLGADNFDVDAQVFAQRGDRTPRRWRPRGRRRWRWS